jgi:hypothetical protein
MVKQNLHAEDALKVVGLWLAGQAKRLTPTITARAKNSISSAVKGGQREGLNDGTPGAKGKGVKASSEDNAKESEGVPIPKDKLKVWIGTSVDYFPFIEFGTHRTGKSGSLSATSSGSKAQAPLRLALFSNKKQILRFLAGRMKK